MNLFPRIEDSHAFLYIEHASITQDSCSVVVVDTDGTIKIPTANIIVLLIGPGTSITHQAIKTITKNGCSIVWTGSEGERFYASGMPETKKSSNILLQASAWANPETRKIVANNLYRKKTGTDLSEVFSIEQLMGFEGIRTRNLYENLANQFAVPWGGREYQISKIKNEDKVNKGITILNQLLYAVVHGVIVSVGYSPAIGFIHSGTQLSFVYDIADIYKEETSIKAAFEYVGLSEGVFNEKDLRILMRKKIYEQKVLENIVSDIKDVLWTHNGCSDSK